MIFLNVQKWPPYGILIHAEDKLDELEQLTSVAVEKEE